MFNTLSLYDEVLKGRPLVSVLYNITTFQTAVLSLVRRTDGVNESRRIKMRVQVADEKSSVGIFEGREAVFNSVLCWA